MKFPHRSVLSVLVLGCLLDTPQALQSWVQQPENQEVNPGGEVTLQCQIANKKGDCRWEKDGVPTGVHPGKYELVGDKGTGDCSIRIIDADLQYDDGVWQCQVTASDFKAKDALISEGAQVVVRESPTSIDIKKVGDSGDRNLIVSAGEELEVECIVVGGNPPVEITWFVRDTKIESGYSQDNSRSAQDSRTWVSVSRLKLPVNKKDDQSKISCVAKHPTLSIPMGKSVKLSVHYPPIVKIETSPYEVLEDGQDPVTLKCLVDSNPKARIIWRREGSSNIFSNESEIHISPVSRYSAGTYSCVAENGLGMSKTEYFELDVKYGPRILTVGPSKEVHARLGQVTVLTCQAEGNPTPRYTWLQKLPREGVLKRGYESSLVIKNTTYDHQGEYVCEAVNKIKGSFRNTQSEAIRIDVTGAPQVIRSAGTEFHEVRVGSGKNTELKVLFCADPMPSLTEWHLDDETNRGKPISLVPGTGDKRFFVQEIIQAEDRKGCYYSSLRINGAHKDDSHAYRLRVQNQHGEDWQTVHLHVDDFVAQESLIGIAVAVVVTFLLLILALIYCCKSGKCCSCSKSESKLKPNDMESEKTDIESTHSSNISGFPPDKALSAIPPDALYASSEKAQQIHAGRVHFGQQDQHEFVFNNGSKESLRYDVTSNLNRTHSSSGDLNISQQRISYNDLCFPKTSNYGSMKKKKNHVGVDCRLARGFQAPPAPLPGASPGVHSALY